MEDMWDGLKWQSTLDFITVALHGYRGAMPHVYIRGRCNERYDVKKWKAYISETLRVALDQSTLYEGDSFHQQPLTQWKLASFCLGTVDIWCIKKNSTAKIADTANKKFHTVLSVYVLKLKKQKRRNPVECCYRLLPYQHELTTQILDLACSSALTRKPPKSESTSKPADLARSTLGSRPTAATMWSVFTYEVKHKIISNCGDICWITQKEINLDLPVVRPSVGFLIYHLCWPQILPKLRRWFSHPLEGKSIIRKVWNC